MTYLKHFKSSLRKIRTQSNNHLKNNDQLIVMDNNQTSPKDKEGQTQVFT